MSTAHATLRPCPLTSLIAVAALVAACGETNTVASIQGVSYVEARQGPAIGASEAKDEPLGGISAPGSRPLSGSQCDVCDAVRGVDNCGNPCGGAKNGADCDSYGLCPCSFGGYALVGRCTSRPASNACTFCPSGTRSSDPCSGTCEVIDEDQAPPPDGKTCPSSHPVSCGSSETCCPSSHSTCCPGGSLCGGSRSDCDDDAPWYERHKTEDYGGGAESPGGDGCAVTCAGGLQQATLRSGCCQSSVCPSSCADGCRNVWYEARGQLFGLCDLGDTSCVQSAASAAISACQ